MKAGNITPGDPCVECDRPMRPNRWKPDRLPGSVQHKSRGLCGKCHLAVQNEHYDPLAPIVVHGLDNPELRDTARALLHWVTARRRRGIPTTGEGTRP